MLYLSTRGHPERLDFRGATLRGLAPDGGLYVPEAWPRFARNDIESMAELPYAQLAAKILAAFARPILSEGELLPICEEVYSGFDHPDVAPLVELDPGILLLELFHGPTLAFKDFALQIVGRLLERFADGEQPLTVIGATSGDTGSAAIHALAGRKNVRLIMLHPRGRISEIQRLQMTTADAPNIHNIAVEGTFDDAQAIVKDLFAHERLRHLRLAAVNSINWARIAAQTVYYFHAALRLGAPHKRVSFAVPTGNFGNVYSGYVASRMGLAIERLIVATNVNDICHRALAEGDYSVREVIPTQSPSMDIQVSSNLERLLFETADREATALAAAMRQFSDSGRLDISGWIEPMREIFASERVSEVVVANVMASAAKVMRKVLDPHTAVGLAAAQRQSRRCEAPIVTLATAHAAKFSDAVKSAAGVDPEIPDRLLALRSRPEHYEVCPPDPEVIADAILMTE